jgi:hypothetical protein
VRLRELLPTGQWIRGALRLRGALSIAKPQLGSLGQRLTFAGAQRLVVCVAATHAAAFAVGAGLL